MMKSRVPLYKYFCCTGEKPGGCAVLKRGKRYVYYLITKEKYWQKPTYETMRSSLEAMKKHCEQHDVTYVAMPKIGCGLDRLQWGKVAEIIKQVFSTTNIAVTVYIMWKVTFGFGKRGGTLLLKGIWCEKWHLVLGRGAGHIWCHFICCEKWHLILGRGVGYILVSL